MVRSFRNRLPVVHSTAFVDESAQVVGDVEIGAESSVWMLAVIRGDVNQVRIGQRTNVQDGTVIHVMHDTYPTNIGDDVTIGHRAIVHGCTLGNRVLVGMGAIILNGATVGEDSIVAAGALITEGAVVAPRSLVMGAPGKFRRSLSDEEVRFVLESAENYVRYRLDYRN
jgi:carbonic anhydrase/acetyltransferase-like protein (isoleucine patch superfamily)